MKTVCVSVIPVRIMGKAMWNCNCSNCHADMLADDLRSAIRLARRHIKECKNPVLWADTNLHALSQAWPHWIIGFM